MTELEKLAATVREAALAVEAAKARAAFEAALEGDVKAQWALGNRGVHGDWRVKTTGDL
jgi:hypothetical protein